MNCKYNHKSICKAFKLCNFVTKNKKVTNEPKNKKPRAKTTLE